jgi:hypothetical protein
VVWTQGLHLEPLLQPFLVMGFFLTWGLANCFPGCLRTVILLISASWVARTTDVSHHQYLASLIFFVCLFFETRTHTVPRLASNSPSFYLSLPSAAITGLGHHAQFTHLFFISCLDLANHAAHIASHTFVPFLPLNSSKRILPTSIFNLKHHFSESRASGIIPLFS